MRLDRLRARLDRLERGKVNAIGQDRARDAKRRQELFYRNLYPGLSKPEEAEYARLNELFREEDKRRGRKLELGLRSFMGRKLTEAEELELEVLDREFPPDPNDPLKEAFRAMEKASCEVRPTPEHARRRARPSLSKSDGSL